MNADGGTSAHRTDEDEAELTAATPDPGMPCASFLDGRQVLAAPPREPAVESSRDTQGGVNEQTRVLVDNSPESAVKTPLQPRDSQEINAGTSGKGDSPKGPYAALKRKKFRSPAKQRSRSPAKVQSSSRCSRVFLEETREDPGAVVKKGRFSPTTLAFSDDGRKSTV